jgi:DNA-binding transcriptional ArsR family regulator
MFEVAVIDDPAAAEVSLDPTRTRLLAALAEPQSATALAARVGLPRQKVNYHLKALERHGLVELVEERRKGNVNERVLRATASSYVISPAALAQVQPDPGRSPDRLSARWLLALAARLVRDVGDLITGSARAGKPVATFAMDGTVRFASAADRAAFAGELAHAVTALVAKYHDDQAPRGRDHRVVVALHPSITKAAGGAGGRGSSGGAEDAGGAGGRGPSGRAEAVGSAGTDGSPSADGPGGAEDATGTQDTGKGEEH